MSGSEFVSHPIAQESAAVPLPPDATAVEQALPADMPVTTQVAGELATQTAAVQQPKPSELPWTEEHGERFRMVREDPRIATLATSLATMSNHPDRDVLFAEICIRVARSEADIAGGAYIALAATIGRRLCIDNTRARGASTRPPLQLREKVPDAVEARDPFEQIRLRQSLTPLLTKLSTDQRDVVREVYLSDLTVDDTAKKLGIPASTVKSHLLRARKKMRRRAQELGYYSGQL